MTGIIIKNYEHFNRALPNWDSPKGKYIKSKKHYQEEVAKAGLVPFSESESMANKYDRDRARPYDLSKKAREVMDSARQGADKKGKIQWSGRLVEGMKDVGVAFNHDHCPSHYKNKGGFDSPT